MINTKLRRRIVLAAPALILGRRALAQLATTGAGCAGPCPYGVGDILPNAATFVGLRAYNGANANNATVINLRRSSDNATSDFGLTNGYLNQATIAAWGGVAATGTGSISGTTLTISGVGTPVVGGQVTGTGVLPGTVIIAFSNPNWSVNQSQTVASTTITVANALLVTKLYDQSGNSAHATQVTTANQPPLLLNFMGAAALPVIAAAQGVVGAVWSMNLTLASGLTQPAALTMVDQNLTVVSPIVSDVTRGGNVIARTTTNTVSVNFGTGLGNNAATDGVPFAYAALGSGASSVVNVNGTEVTGSANTGNLGPALHLFTNAAASSQMSTFLGEFAAWGANPAASVRAALIRNMRSYWQI